MGSLLLQNEEAARVRVLREYAVLDTPPEQAYDDITALASHICKTPMALLSFVDSDRQWFKAKKGLETEETPREHSFCSHAILNPSHVMVVPDAQRDDRFANNPLVMEPPHIRFYAGAPLVAPQGEALGTLCVVDRESRELSEQQIKYLRALARQAVALLELRRSQAAMFRSKLEQARDRIRTLEAQVLALQRIQDDLRAEHSFRKAVIERAAEGVCVCHAIPTSPFLAFTVWNRRMTEITGYTMKEINRRGWYQSVYPDPKVQKRAVQRMERMRHGDDLRFERWVITHKDGQKRALAISTSVLTSADGLKHVLALMHDVTERERLQEEATLGQTDALTGVRTRRQFRAAAAKLIQLASRSGAPTALAFIDLDDLKKVNDELGHAEGDRVLARVGAVLADATRSTDIAGRLGGDEFAVLLPNTDATGARAFFDKLHQLVGKAMREQGWPTGVSMGVGLFPTAPPSEGDALRFADSLMYQAKKSSKNRVVYEMYTQGQPSR